MPGTYGPLHGGYRRRGLAKDRPCHINRAPFETNPGFLDLSTGVLNPARNGEAHHSGVLDYKGTIACPQNAGGECSDGESY